jgi:hypothetical protein
MAELRITCVDKVDRKNPHERILAVGGGTLAAPWKKTQTEVINLISIGEVFYVLVGGKRANVVVDRHNGREYIRTEPDDSRQNNLLSLPPCP